MSHQQRRPVLIGFDGYEDAAAAIRGAGALLGPRPAVVAYVWEPLAGLLLHAEADELTGTMREAADEFDAGETDRAEGVSKDGAQLAKSVGFEAQAVSVRGRPKVWPALLQLAEEHDAAAIVIGTEGLGAVKSALLGSVSRGLLHRSKRPLLIVPNSEGTPPDGPVVIAYDGSEHARRAIEVAGTLFGGRAAIVETVWTSWEAVAAAGRIGVPAAVAAVGAERMDQDLAGRAERTAAEGAALAGEVGLQARAEVLKERGNVRNTLVESASAHGAASIVVGSRGRSAVGAALLGSVAAGLAHGSPVPLLVVPPD